MSFQLILIFYFLFSNCFCGNKGQNKNLSITIKDSSKINMISKDSNIINFEDENVFKPGYYYDSSRNILPFRILFPLGYNNTKKYPLVIFFHGAGETGNDNISQLTHGSELFKNKFNMEMYPCFVIFPQCSGDEKWVDADWTEDKSEFKENPNLYMQLSIGLLNKLIFSYNIDTNRLYVMGISMGGFAVWDIISRMPGKFAAAVPICGGGDENSAVKIKNIPIWAFHGDKDKIVNVNRSRNMIEVIKNSGGNPKYTEYKNVGHGSWNNAFNEPDLLQWIFSQTKNK